ncbi:DNA polymerase, partial [Bacillus sp. HC-TM]
MTPKLTLNLKIPGAAAVEETKARVAQAVERKVKATETMEDAWQRILSMKNNESDRQRLAEVKEVMTKGEIGRSPSDLAKRFSKAEA